MYGDAPLVVLYATTFRPGRDPPTLDLQLYSCSPAQQLFLGPRFLGYSVLDAA